MFNFYKIVNKFIEYRSSKIHFCEDYTLSHYLFYQSAQKTDRIDLAYLNTVKMMEDEITLIEGKLLELLGDEQYERINRKLKYILMIHL